MHGILVANWKENGTSPEAKAWVEKLSHQQLALSKSKVIVCPPFTMLQHISEQIKKTELSMSVGAQDISRFEEGKYTGEVSAKMLREFVTYVIIGHSERRQNFGETNDIVAEKIKIAIKHNLTPIVCVSEIDQVANLQHLLPNLDGIIAYEPLFAIGTGNPDTPENANAMAGKIKAIFPNIHVLYGGSVDGLNVGAFVTQPSLSGALVGNRSLDSDFFLEIVKNAN